MSHITSLHIKNENEIVSKKKSPLGQDTQKNLLDLYLLRFDSPNTRRAYKQDLISFFETKNVYLQDVSSVSFVEVNAFVERMEKSGLAPSTRRRRLAALRGFYNWLIALQAVDHNPADRQLVRRIRQVKNGDRPIKALTQKQAKELLKAVNHDSLTGPRDFALLQTLLRCVLRRSEAAAMDFEHIEPMGRHWILRLPHTKGGSNQYVKIPKICVDSINQLKDVYGWSSGPIWRSLSNNSLGDRLSPTSIYRIVRKISKKAGIKSQIGAHTLRHTGCTLAIEAGASVQQVKEHARHKNLETTMTYVHQRDKLDNSAADFIDL